MGIGVVPLVLRLQFIALLLGSAMVGLSRSEEVWTTFSDLLASPLLVAMTTTSGRAMRQQ